MRFQHVAVEGDGLDRVYRAGEALAELGHQRGVVATATGDQQAGDRLGEMLGGFGNTSGGDGGQGGCGIGVGQAVGLLEEGTKIVAVQ
ncbi:MAG: hypothetical protein ACD_54C01074G0001 [uncultured bacterium]|nr:MAG: hypothetical protein ACD_54C01074G0001 [uncultured bacterium]